MKRRNFVTCLLASSILVAGLARPAMTQEQYPTKPITIIVPSAAGGGLDLAARKTAEKMAEYLDQPVIIDNRPGAGSLIGTRMAVAADSDGYTLLAHATTMSLYPYTVKNLGFDVQKDLEPVGVMMRQTNVFSVGKNSPFSNFQDLIAFAKSNPAAIRFGHGGSASPQSYTVRLVMAATGTVMEGVQYKGASDTYPDVIADRIDLISAGYQGQAGFFSNGLLRPVAVTSGNRLEVLPDVPTLKELGIDVESQAWLGLLAPAGTPVPVLAKLSDAVKFALEDEVRRAELAAESADGTFLTRDEMRQLITGEVALFGQMADAMGLVQQ